MFSFCCNRSKPVAPAPIFDTPTVPLNYCEWCENDLDTCVAYTLNTLNSNTKNPHVYRIGQCCVDSGELTNYVSDFNVEWGFDPQAYLDPTVTHWNVSHMFEEAKARHYDGDREGARDMFRSAWRTYKKLTEEEKKLVRK